MKKRGIVMLLTFVLAVASMAGLTYAADTPVPPEDIKNGITMRVLRTDKAVNEIVVGDMIDLELWVYNIDPMAIALPIKFNPKVLQVVDKRQGDTKYTKVTNGYKTAEDQRTGNAGFKTYDTPSYDPVTWEPTYWNGRMQYTKAYPYLNNDTGVYKFLLWSDNPYTAKTPNRKMTISFRAVGTGNAGLGIAVKADGDHLLEEDDERNEYYDISAPEGAMVLFPDDNMYLPTDDTETIMDNAEIYTDLIEMPKLEVVDVKTNLKPGFGGGDTSSTPAPTATAKPSPTPTPGPPTLKTELVKKPEVPTLPLQDTVSMNATIKPNASNEITNSCEYIVTPKDLETLLSSEEGRKAKDLVINMPDEILPVSQYIINIRTIYFPTMEQQGMKNVYFNTPYGTVGMLVPAFLRTKSRVDGELKFVVSGGEGTLRVSCYLDGILLDGVKTGRIAKIAIPYTVQNPEKAVMTYAKGESTSKIPLSVYYETEKLMYAMYTDYGNFAVQENGEMQFTDLDSVEWAKESIELLADKGVVKGTTETEFSPESQVTREEFSKMLVEAFGLLVPGETSTFTDVESGSWYEPYVASANNAKIVNGVSESEFGVGQLISREDMATMVERAMLSVGLHQKEDENTGDIVIGDEEETFRFADDGLIADYAKDAVYSMQKESILSGKEGSLFDPKGYATRGEAAKIIGIVFQRMLEKIPV